MPPTAVLPAPLNYGASFIDMFEQMVVAYAPASSSLLIALFG